MDKVKTQIDSAEQERILWGRVFYRESYNTERGARPFSYLIKKGTINGIS